jgi:hypothetical protein
VTFLLLLGVWVLVTVLSFVVTAIVIVRLPAGYFASDRPPAPYGGTPMGLAKRIARNLLGLLLIVVGLALSLPGIPGQGILTILLGVILVDFPGRRRAERWLVSRPGVLKAMNRLRRRFGAPPLREPGPAS